MTRSLTVLAAAVVLGLGGTSSNSPQSGTTGEIMRLKLSHAQELLTALVLEDYDGIEEHAFRLDMLSEASNWNVFQTQDYARHSADFRRAAQALAEAGRKRGLDAAAHAYVAMTLECVQCHKYVRDARPASGCLWNGTPLAR
ncbi:MAG: hypothetical protein ACE5JI_19985 [Acidobacteriota bacterium]